MSANDSFLAKLRVIHGNLMRLLANLRLPSDYPQVSLRVCSGSVQVRTITAFSTPTAKRAKVVLRF